jgi:succinoglycan biosynthesis protein ExoL
LPFILSDLKMNSIIVLSQSLQQPRVIKRVKRLCEEYPFVFLYSFERPLYSNMNSSLLLDCKNLEIINLGIVQNSSFFSRIFKYFKLWYFIFFRFFLKRKNVYAFGLDMRFLAVFVFNSKIHYEISDLMWLYLKSPYKFIFKSLDQILVYFSNRIVFTSKSFYDTYFSFIPMGKIDIVENKFKTYGRVKPISKIKLEKVSILYLGAFRYTNILKDLVYFVSSNNKFNLIVAGDGDSSILSFLREASSLHDNIRFLGAFKNPDDLEYIYSLVNLNFVAYDNKLQNEKVAMPNKFYESIFFNIPIVCSKDTYLSERVENLDVGWSIQPNLDNISSFLNCLSVDDVYQKHQNIVKLNKNLFFEL